MTALLKRWYGGIQHRPHPLAPFELYFDGFRNLGWSVGGLAAFEAGEMRFIADLYARHPTRCAWDIGANVGLWTLFLAGLQPQIEKIVSFEPDPANLKLLRLNCENNHLDRVQVRDVALSSTPGEAKFYADPTTGSTGSLEKDSDFIGKHYGASRQEVITRVSTIDAEVAAGLPVPGLMKIDVEGHELSVLQGGRATLAAHHPIILFETTRDGDEIGRLLQNLGYRLLDPSTGAQIDHPGFSTVAVAEGA
jgi:FkbM family methyltransferase